MRFLGHPPRPHMSSRAAASVAETRPSKKIHALSRLLIRCTLPMKYGVHRPVSYVLISPGVIGLNVFEEVERLDNARSTNKSTSAEGDHTK